MPEKLKMRNFERERAKKAYDYVNNVLNKDKEIQSNYKSYVRNMPMLIKTNGLLSAICFIFEKKKDGDNKKEAYEILYNQIGEWLSDKKIIKNDIIEDLLTFSSAEYKYATIETIELLIWLKRFVDGLIVKETK